MDEIKKLIIDLLKSAGVSGNIELTSPPKPEMGDFCFACFDIAKQNQKNPQEVARDLSKKIKQSEIINNVEANGPYVNFFINSGVAVKILLASIIKQNKSKLSNIGQKGKVVIEYPSNNTHKELHIGHLRNICIGNSLVQLSKHNGYNVAPINYINDFGAHVAKCLWGLIKFHNKEEPPANKQKWLGEIYAEASRYLEEHPEFKLEVQEIQKKLESGDKGIEKLYSRTRKWSLDQFKKIYKQLGVYHKKTFYEKEVKKAGQKMVDNLIESGVAKTGEGGAIIVDLSSYGLDIALLRKSDGTGLYLTSDLGLAFGKNLYFRDYKESIHLTGTEQNFYFKQLFKILALAGYDYKMTHIGYGLVSLTEGKMSSRSGRVVLYEDVWQMVYDKALLETADRHTDWSRKKLEKTAQLIAMSAIKFDFLKHESSKAMVFDPVTAVSFDGFTGPYILYTIARINSIIRKKKICARGIDFGLLVEPEEKRLTIKMAELKDVAVKAMANYNPSIIAKYAFDTAKLYNDFYSKHSVLKANNQELVNARVFLSSTVKDILTKALELLSIETIKEM
jgi:arginyl-tRNA synthetase